MRCAGNDAEKGKLHGAISILHGLVAIFYLSGGWTSGPLKNLLVFDVGIARRDIEMAGRRQAVLEGKSSRRSISRHEPTQPTSTSHATLVDAMNISQATSRTDLFDQDCYNSRGKYSDRPSALWDALRCAWTLHLARRIKPFKGARLSAQPLTHCLPGLRMAEDVCMRPQPTVVGVYPMPTLPSSTGIANQDEGVHDRAPQTLVMPSTAAFEFSSSSSYR